MCILLKVALCSRQSRGFEFAPRAGDSGRFVCHATRDGYGRAIDHTKTRCPEQSTRPERKTTSQAQDTWHCRNMWRRTAPMPQRQNHWPRRSMMGNCRCGTLGPRAAAPHPETQVVSFASTVCEVSPSSSLFVRAPKNSVSAGPVQARGNTACTSSLRPCSEIAVVDGKNKHAQTRSRVNLTINWPLGGLRSASHGKTQSYATYSP